MRWASRNPTFCILSCLNKAEQDHIKLDTAGKLAALQYDSKLITVNHHARNTDDEAFDEKDMTGMAKASIARQIQKHINAESTDIVSGDYPVPYCIEKVSGKQEYIIPMRAGRETEIEIQAYEPNDAMEISVSCRSEVQMIKKVFSTDYMNQALAENPEKQYRSYRAAEKQLPHR